MLPDNLGKLFPEHIRRGGKCHKGWSVVDVVLCCPDSYSGRFYSGMKTLFPSPWECLQKMTLSLWGLPHLMTTASWSDTQTSFHGQPMLNDSLAWDNSNRSPQVRVQWAVWCFHWHCITSLLVPVSHPAFLFSLHKYWAQEHFLINFTLRTGPTTTSKT